MCGDKQIVAKAGQHLVHLRKHIKVITQVFHPPQGRIIVGKARDVAPLHPALTCFETDGNTDDLSWFYMNPEGVSDIYNRASLWLFTCVSLLVTNFLSVGFILFVSIISDPF